MQLDLWQIAVLAIVQGLTEFLPVSSSGHLVLLSSWLGDGEISGPLNIMLHVGTLGSVCVVYGERVVRLWRADRGVLGWILLATIPAAAVGLPLRLLAGSVLEQPLLAGVLLLVTGGLLLLMPCLPRGEREYTELGWWRALLIGLAQAVAILPGISRSGSTIFAGLGLGLKPRAAASFSFLLALPVIGGAGLVELLQLSGSDGAAVPWLPLLVGMAIAFVVGWGALVWVQRWLERGRLHWFAWWCLPLGLIVLGRHLFLVSCSW